MPEKAEDRSSVSPKAEPLYREYRRLRAKGTSVDFDTFCRQYPDLEDALRAIHSLQGATTAPAEETSGWELRAGDFVGPYRLTSVLGEGGFGTVFLADQEEPLKRQVALKVLKAGMDTKEIVARFETERQALALMNHPGVAKVFDAGTTLPGRPYFVMEYVSGKPISQYCDGRGLGTRERLRLFVQVCEAVQHAHQKAIIHRDIKSSNVLVTEHDGRPAPKIIDFGIAKAVHQQLTAKTIFTTEGKLMGTPEYMSPEQAEMKTLDVDTRTDIYSLGVLLYELLCGALPFDSKALRKAGILEIPRILREEDPLKPSTRLSRLGEDSAEVARRRSADSRSLIRELRGDLDCIVMKAMAKDRDRRYASASELASDVDRHLRFEPVLARPPSIAYRTRKIVRKHRAGLAILAGFLVLAGSYAAVSHGISQARLRETVAHLRQAIAGEDLETAKAELAVLEDRHPTSTGNLQARRQVEALERKLNVKRSEEIRLEAAGNWTRHGDLVRTQEEIQRQWLEEKERLPTWAPVWERQLELELWGKLQEVRIGVEDSYNKAALGLHSALQVAPQGSEEMLEVRRALEDVYLTRYEAAEERGEVPVTAAFLKRQIEAFGTGAHAEDLQGGGRVVLASSPSGAEVYCFRYEERDGRRVPLPFSATAGREAPAEGLLEEPSLEIDGVWDGQISDFERGDRILEVDGKPVRTHGDLARMLSQVSTDQELAVRVLRKEKEERLPWIPYPSAKYEAKGPLQPGRMLDPFAQFGLTFAAYPLAFRKENLVGVTKDGAAVEAELPSGSYLFVLRKDGYVDTRFPLAVPPVGPKETVRLLKRDEIPPEFVYVPEGPLRTGGDSKAFQSLPWGTTRVKGFFMGRFEVTVGEWLRFVNDPEVLQRTNSAGELLPEAQEVKEELPAARKGRLHLFSDQESWWRRESEGGPWVFKYEDPPDRPAFGISQLAAIEYAHWRTKKESTEGRHWEYRLPTDLEWERAARGVDRRTYVWGDYLVWSFCSSYRGIVPPRRHRIRGSHPFDESVFGVRDLEGSVTEHTTGKPARDLPNTAYRGGSWESIDEEFFRLSSRNSLLPENCYAYHSGLRLVANLGP